MRVAVTGGTGFIGGALVRALIERGDEVRVVTRKRGRLKVQHPNLTESTWNELAERPEPLLYVIIEKARVLTMSSLAYN